MQKIVSQLLGVAGCSRVDLFQYSNGEKTLTGDCYRYVRCTVEDCKPGIASVMEEFSRKFIDPDIAFLLDKIDKSDRYYVIDVEDLKGTQRMLQNTYGSTYSINFKLGKSVWEGVLSFVWINTEVEKLTDEKIDLIETCIMQINKLKK